MPQNTLTRLIGRLGYHLHTMFLFIQSDISILILCYLFVAINASVASRLSLGKDMSFAEIISVCPRVLLLCGANLLLFNLHNQRHSSAEDKINKPWRPMASGRLTTEQASVITLAMHPIVLAVSLMIGGTVPAIAAAFLDVWYNDWNGSSNPILKNVITAFGLMAHFLSPLEVATRHSIFSGNCKGAVWFVLLSFAMSTTAHAQDFRDRSGDSAVGRKTIPLVLGDSKARYLLVAGVVGWTAAACQFWGVSFTGAGLAWVSGLAMAGNFLRDRTEKGDIFSYRIWPIWLIGMFTLPLSTPTETFNH